MSNGTVSAIGLTVKQGSRAAVLGRSISCRCDIGEVGFKHIESFIDESDGERCERFALDGAIGSSLLASTAMPDR